MRAVSTAPAANTRGPATNACLALAWVFPEVGVLRLMGLERALLGRGDDVTCCVGGAEASRHHAELVRDGPIWILRDLGSTNGSFVDGERVRQAPVGPGTVLRIGEAVAVAILAGEGGAPLGTFRELGPGFFGGSSLQRLLEGTRRAAESDLPVVVEGETGCGKERLARWIHETSSRPGAFVAINCAALPESLAEAELFGYRRGAFTGANQASLGHFRAAHTGTLLLDEILDLPLPLQAKLLRVLEEREVSPLGEAVPVPIDVRVVAASQAPLEEAVHAGRFRGDLFARLDGFSVRIPPLRERLEDVVPLFQSFLAARSGGRPPALDARLVEALCLHDWPFNVRELELLSRRLLILHGHEPALRRSHLPARVGARLAVPNEAALASSGDDYSRFLALLKAHGGIVARAAAAAGISRPRAYRLMAEHDLDLDTVRRGEASAT